MIIYNVAATKTIKKNCSKMLAVLIGPLICPDFQNHFIPEMLKESAARCSMYPKGSAKAKMNCALTVTVIAKEIAKNIKQPKTLCQKPLWLENVEMVFPIPNRYLLFMKLDGESMSGRIEPKQRIRTNGNEKLKEKTLINKK